MNMLVLCMLASLLVGNVIGQATYSCTYTSSTGTSYDINSLRNDSEDYEVTIGTTFYYINFCRQVISTECNDATASICQTYTGGEAVVARNAAAFFDLPAASGSSGLQMVLSGGDRANVNGVVYPRNATINLVCGQATGALTFIAESPALHYSFSMTTPAACPTSGPVGTTGSQSGGNTCNNKPILVTIDATNYINQTYPFDTTSSTSLQTVACPMYNSAWVQINNVPIGSRVLVSTCNAPVNFDSKIALMYSCASDSTTNAVTCNDDSCTIRTIASTAIIESASQSTVYALIGGYAASDKGLATVRVTVSAAAVTPIPSTTGTQVSYPCGRPIAQVIDAGQGAFNGVVAIDTTVSQFAQSTFCPMYSSVYIQINNVRNGSIVNVSTCGGNNAIDTKIALFDACINQAAALNCNDDNNLCTVGNFSGRSSLSRTIARSSTIWAMIGSYAANVRGRMNVSISVVPNTIALPTCNNQPIAATIDASANGGSSTTLISTISTDNNIDTSSFGPVSCLIYHGSWIRISNVAPGSSITVSTCGASNIDTKIALYQSCNTVTTTAACNDDANGSCGTRSNFTLTAAVYTEYYAYIGTYSEGGSGSIPTTVVITPGSANNTVVTYDCTYTSSRGNAYDFGALRNDTGDYIVTIDNGQRYFINMCRSIVGFRQCGNRPDADMCQVHSGGQAIIGRGTVAISDVTGTDGQGATFTYSNGDGGRSSIINMRCNQAAGVGFPTFVSESPILRYNFEWQTSYACATTTVTNCASRPVVQTIDFGNAYSSRNIAINGAGFPSHIVTDTSCSMWNSMWILVQNVPIGARLNATTCSTLNNTDTKIGIYSTCTALNSIVCNDDFGTCGYRSLAQTIVSQTSYYLLVGYFSNRTGPLTLTVATQVVVAPTCNPIGVIDANNGEIQRVFAYNSGADPTIATETSCTMYKPQWVQITNIAAGSSLIAHTCGGNTLDTKLAVFANCGDATALECNDDSCGLRSMVEMDNIVQSTLWIQVGLFSSNGNGTVPLNITIMEGGGYIPQPCTYLSTRGNMYDLGALRLNDTDYIVTDPVGQVYYINLCGSIVNAATCGNSFDADMCQTYPGGHAVIGRGNMYYSDIGPTGYGITVNYRGGDVVGDIGYGRNATLKIYCNQTAGRGYPTFVAENPILNYQFTWQSSLVCPTGTVTTCDDRPVFEVDVSATPATSVTVDTSTFPYDRTTDTGCRMYNSAYILLNNVPLGSVINATTCGGATIDTLIGMYSSCTALSSMACNDDSCGLQSFLKYQGTNQTSYYLLVGAYRNETSTITVNINVAPYTAPTSPFPLCENKPIIYTIDAANTGFSRSGLYYTQAYSIDDAALSAACPMYRAAWVQIINVPFGFSLSASTCGLADFDTKLAWLTSCSDSTAVTCVDDSCGSQSLVTISSTESSTYYLLVGLYSSFTTNATFNFNISLGQGAYIPHECTYTSSRGNFYDFTSLQDDDQDYTLTDSTGQRYIINMCRTLVDPTVCGQYAVDVDICQASNGAIGSAVVGRGSPTYTDIQNADFGVTMTFARGDNGRTAVVRMLCNQAAGHGSPRFVNQSPSLTYNFEWQTSQACPAATPVTCVSRPVADSLDFFNASGHHRVYIRPQTSPLTTDTSCPMYNAEWIEIHNVPIGANINATTCGGSTVDTKIAIYSTCTAVRSTMCNDDSCGLQSLVQMKRATQTSYYILVGTYGVLNPSNLSVTISVQSVYYPPPTTYPCQLTTPSGFNYDLSSLRNDTGDYTVTDSNGQTYFINMCRSIVSSDVCGSPSDPANVCQTYNGGFAVVGRQNAVITDSGVANAFNLMFTNGDPATVNGNQTFGRNATIKFFCDPSAGIGYPVFFSENPILHYNFIWQSAAACSVTALPTSGASSSGSSTGSGPAQVSARFHLKFDGQLSAFAPTISIFFGRVATALQIRQNQLGLVSLTSGSVIIDFTVTGTKEEVDRATKLFNQKLADKSLETDLQVTGLTGRVVDLGNPSDTAQTNGGPSKSALSGGAIAGIVIAAVVVAAIVVVVAVLIARRGSNPDPRRLVEDTSYGQNKNSRTDLPEATSKTNFNLNGDHVAMDDLNDIRDFRASTSV